MSGSDRHWTDEEIVRWVDEGDTPEGIPGTEHLDRCEACRARIAGVEALFLALGKEPPATTGAEMAAQRDRILAAVRARPRAPVRRLSRRSVWLPAIAAAAVAALLLWAPRGSRSPESAPTADVPAAGSATLAAIIVEANRAAEEVAQAAEDPEASERLVGTAQVDLVRPGAGLSIPDGWNEALEIEEEFAALPPADREAILVELGSARFEPQRF